MNFKELNLKKEIIEVLNSIGFSNPTLVQQKVIPLINSRQNICVKSPTGSGKTHTFLLPLFNKIDPLLNRVQGIIMSPTRELAKQIYEMSKPFAAKLNINVLLLSSGGDRNDDIKSISNKIPQLIIGTPGRIKDMAFDNAIFNITTTSYLVMDEGDMILEEGFADEVIYILSKLKENISFMAFSASFPQSLLSILNKRINNLKYIDLSKNNITSANVRHVAYPTRNKDRLTILKHLIDSINPYVCIVFASRKNDVEKIYKDLVENDYNCTIIHGDLSSTQRKTTMKRIQNNEFKIIVASDIASRGIDIEGVSEVINYDLPYEFDFYFHRAGRCGRANLKGTCYTLYDKDEIGKLQKYYEKGIKFENEEYVNGSWVELKDLFIRKKVNKPNPLNDKIREIVNKGKHAKVKPNYKKIQKAQIEHLKRKHKREIIEKDIQRQRREKYKKGN